MKEVNGVTVQGHQVASGRNNDPRFPGGTISMQVPHFREKGLDLSGFHPATINISIAPKVFTVVKADFCFRDVQWHPTEPAEDFSFVACELLRDGDLVGKGYLYFPHPETKPAHFQPPEVMELLLDRWVDGLVYGTPVSIRIREGAIEVKDA